eukprot:scaffold48601_cov309-Isochrysis_galbana.AAC.3
MAAHHNTTGKGFCWAVAARGEGRMVPKGEEAGGGALQRALRAIGGSPRHSGTRLSVSLRRKPGPTQRRHSTRWGGERHSGPRGWADARLLWRDM